MKPRIILAIFLLCAASIAVLGPISKTKPGVTPRPSVASQPRVVQSYGKLPLAFEVNQGQTDGQVKFISRGRGYTMFLTGSEAVLALRAGNQMAQVKGQEAKVEGRAGRLLLSPAALLEGATNNEPPTTNAVPIANLQSSIINPPSLSALRMKLIGASPHAKVTGADPLPGKSNYFIGRDPQKWRTNVPQYAKVKYQGVYPGIDLVYYGNQRQLEYDFAVAPGADPGTIKLAIAGAEGLSIDGKGNLVVQLSAGEVLLHKPVVYQRKADNGPGTTVNRQSSINNRQFLDGRYVLLADNRIAFDVAAYDRSKPLIIDPVLSYSTFLGGSGDDFANGIAVDSAGNAYVVGETYSVDFPATGPPLGPGGNGDIFVTKLNPTGTAQTYSTYLGGSGSEDAYGVAVDASGNAYLTGHTDSTDFPITPGAFQTTLPGSGHAFVTKLNPSGSALVYSTYLGGTFGDWANGIAVDSSGQAYVTGSTYSQDFPTKNAYDATCGSDGLCNNHSYQDAFVTKLNSTGSGLLYSTFLGGNADDVAFALALDSSGNVYVTGYTWSSDFPTINAYDSSLGTDGTGNGGYVDAFVAKINPSLSGASSLVYSTYLGGTQSDGGYGIAVDSSGNAYVTGFTYSPDFPTKSAYDSSCGTDGQCNYDGSNYYDDAFVAKINPSLSGASSLVYSTYLGGAGYDWGNGIVVDSSGSAYVFGDAYSTNFPTTPNAPQAANAGDADLFVTKLTPDGSALVYSTYLGGSKYDQGQSIVLGPNGSVYVAGITYSPNFPTTAGVWDTSCGTDGQCNYDGTTSYADGFVAKLVPRPVASVTPTSLAFGSQLVGVASASQAVTLSNTGDGVLTISIVLGGTDADDFAQTNTCGATLAVSASCTINVTFQPTTPPGDKSASIAITSDSPTSPDTIALSGTGTDFKLGAASGSSTSQTVTAGNAATYNLAFTPIGASGTLALSCAGAPEAATCTVNPASQSLSATSTATVTVTTTAKTSQLPKGGGDYRRFSLPPLRSPRVMPLVGLLLLAILASLAVPSETQPSRRFAAPAWTLAALLLVVGVWVACGGGGSRHTSLPAVTLSNKSLTFNSQSISSTSPAQSVTLTNSGEGTLAITSMSVTGANGSDFAQTNTYGSSVQPGATCQISVTFSPTATGQRTGSVTITDNASDSPQSISLTGTGVPPYTPAGTYNLTVTAKLTSGSATLTHTLPLTLTVN